MHANFVKKWKCNMIQNAHEVRTFPFTAPNRNPSLIASLFQVVSPVPMCAALEFDFKRKLGPVIFDNNTNISRFQKIIGGTRF